MSTVQDLASPQVTVEESVIQQFLNYLQFERHFSPYTARCYGADLRQCCCFLLGVVNSAGHLLRSEQMLKGLTSGDVARYVEFLRQYTYFETETSAACQHYSTRTICRKIATLRSFFKFCNRRGITQNNPMTAIRTPKPEKRLPKFITEEQVTELLKMPQSGNLFGARDKAILECLHSTGIRISELANLNIDDVDFTNNTIKVCGVGKKGRLLPIGDAVALTLRKYLNKRAIVPERYVLIGWPLFVNKYGTRLSMRAVRRKLNEYLIQSGIGLGITPHTFRSTFARHMYDCGRNTRTVKSQLGLLNNGSTRRYNMVSS